MVCSSCSKQKRELHARKSRLVKTMDLILCNQCIEEGLEPRFVVILVGRSPGGHDRIRPYIKHRKYIGPEIQAKELL